MPPDEPTDEERIEELPEDHQTPFNPAASTNADDQDGDSDWDGTPAAAAQHPDTDSNMDIDQVYDEGIVDASQQPVDDLTRDNVTGYTPPDDDDDEE